MATLRRAEPRDEERLLAWRNDPATRESAFTPGVVDPDTHRRWFRARLADPDSVIFIGERGGEAELPPRMIMSEARPVT